MTDSNPVKSLKGFTGKLNSAQGHGSKQKYLEKRCSKGQSEPLPGAAWWNYMCSLQQSWTRWLLRWLLKWNNLCKNVNTFPSQTVLWFRELHSCNLCCSSPCWVVDANTAPLNRWAVRAWLRGVCSACSSQPKCTHVSRGSGRAGAAHKFTAVLCAALHPDEACG